MTRAHPTPVIDWERLHDAAVAASRRAYAPYSGYPVGAAALTSAGRIVTGCNVENAAYGVGLCAECGLVSALHDSAVTRPEIGRELLVAVVCVDGRGTPIMPCGRCRQLLHENAVPGLLVALADGAPITLGELLPHAFGAPDLAALAVARADDRGTREQA